MGEVICLKNVSKSFWMGKVKVDALKGVDISIEEGEFVALMGASGSGKTTLLNQIGLLDIPSKGEVVIQQIDTSKLNEDKLCEFRLSKIGIVFQFFNLFNELSAFDNVMVPAMLSGNQSMRSRERAVMLLGLVGLGNRINHYPSELSGGQQQRVAIARALMNDPPILLTDEPTANLDSSSSKEIIGLFRNLNKELKKTVVMVTHEEHFGQMADRVIRIKDGKVESDKKNNLIENVLNIPEE